MPLPAPVISATFFANVVSSLLSRSNGALCRVGHEKLNAAAAVNCHCTAARW
jgi:hypothetical protein